MLCGKTFKSKSILTTHLNIIHNPEPMSPKVNICPFSTCKKTFARSTVYQDHLHFHTGVKPYQCAVCDKAFHFRYKKNQLERICSGKVEHCCNECGVVFSEVSSLKRHCDSQHLKTLYNCSCGKRYAYYSSLFKHKKIKKH